MWKTQEQQYNLRRTLLRTKGLHHKNFSPQVRLNEEKKSWISLVPCCAYATIARHLNVDCKTYVQGHRAQHGTFADAKVEYVSERALANNKNKAFSSFQQYVAAILLTPCEPFTTPTGRTPSLGTQSLERIETSRRLNIGRNWPAYKGEKR